MPIIDLQRRLVEAGRIRAGDRPEGSTHPRKLKEWRLTSRDRARLDAAASQWGGEVRAWAGHDGEFELYTERSEIPIMLLPGTTASSWYELWSAGGCQRRCDGAHEVLSDGPCLCGDERECKPTTRLPVLLPDIPGLGTWMVSSTGWNAARELAASAELLGQATAQGVFIAARLRLEWRSEIKEGQTRRYVVPVIDIDVTLRDLLGQQVVRYEIGPGPTNSGNAAATGGGWTPIVAAERTGSTLTQAIEAVEQQEPHRGPRSAPQISPAEDDIFQGEAVPVPIPDEAEGVVEHRTAAQTRKLNVLVGKLRETLDEDGKPRLTTEQLWSAVATMRGVDRNLLISALGGLDIEGVLHWSPLRDGLTKAEASSLIDRLERYEGHVA
jgi:hypothetical protein